MLAIERECVKITYMKAVKPTNDEVVTLWRERIVLKSKSIEKQSDKGHDWHSLWSGFVTGLNRPDLRPYSKYMSLGFPVELNAPVGS